MHIYTSKKEFMLYAVNRVYHIEKHVKILTDIYLWSKQVGEYTSLWPSCLHMQPAADSYHHNLYGAEAYNLIRTVCVLDLDSK